MVELQHRGQRVASDARNGRVGGVTTTPAHMPAAHRAHIAWTPQRLVHWGESVGPATAEAVTQLTLRAGNSTWSTVTVPA